MIRLKELAASLALAGTAGIWLAAAVLQARTKPALILNVRIVLEIIVTQNKTEQKVTVTVAVVWR
jgi:hypothetical protein